MYPGFWSCGAVGTNHPVHPDTACALVFASPSKDQFLETSALIGDTTHLNGDALHIKNPPSYEEPNAGPGSTKVVKL